MPPGFGGQDPFGNNPDQSQQDQQDKTDMAAGDAPGHAFHGNQYTEGEISIDEEEKAKKIASLLDEQKKLRKQMSDLEYGGGKGAAHRGSRRMPKIEETRIKLYKIKQELSRLGAPPELSLSEKRKLRFGNAQIESGDKTGHPFRGNQYMKMGDYVQTPHGRGMIVINEYDSAYVSVGGTIRKYPKAQLTKIPYDHSNFPSITHSAEDERRKALQMRSAEVFAIEDDAVFAEELKWFAKSL